MTVLIRESSILLWQDVVRQAVTHSNAPVHPSLEAYLVGLLMRSTSHVELVHRRVALAFLAAQQEDNKVREFSLQQVGDQCLLLTGLFPQITKRRLVNLSYFVDLGKSAYAEVSRATNDLFWSLAIRFVDLMDVLQCIRPYSELLPLEAYEQWQDVGSKRALQMLQRYTRSIP